MSQQIDLDRRISAYFESRTTSQAPDGLVEAALAGVERTNQRPAWSVADRWLRPLSIRVGPTSRLVTVAGVVALVLLSLALAILIGSSRHRLPPPFGIAKPGLVAFDLGGDIFVGNADGTGRRQLTFGPDTDASPVWSPDGTSLAFASRLEDLTWSVTVMNADGGHRVTLAEDLSLVGGIAWSPDSRRVAYGARTPLEARGTDGYDWRLYLAEADRPGATQLGGPDVFGLAPSWSPDGTVIAFKRVYPGCGPRCDVALWRIRVDGTDARRLSTEKELYNSAGGYDAFWNTVWSPDGNRLAYVADGIPPPGADPNLDSAYDVYVVDADGTREQDITSSPQEEFWPTWSPDGSQIAFVRMSAFRPKAGSWSDIYAPLEGHLGTLIVANPDGTNLIPMRDPPVDSAAPVWSPDGKKLLAYVFDATSLNDNAIAVFDPSAQMPTITIPANGFNSATWQRLALDPNH